MDEDLDPIFNEIAKSIIERGGIVDVYRLGCGVLGSFKNITPARGSWKNDPVTGMPIRRDVITGFWCINHSRGSEIMIGSAYDKLEIRKIESNIFHVIIPA